MKQNLEALFKEFLKEQEYSSRLSKITLLGYVQAFQLLQTIMPGIEINDLTDKTMAEFFKRLETRERKVGRGYTKKGIRKSTIATYRSKLNKFFVWLKHKGNIKQNPFDSMEYPNVTYENIQYLRKEDIERIIVAVSFKIKWKNPLIRKRNLAILYVMLCCGLRKGEVLGLKILDIDLERRILNVRAETSKSRLNRSIPLNASVMPILQDYMEELKLNDYSTPYLFVSNNKNERLTDHGFKHLMDIVKNNSGVSFHAHQFRHTFAVTFLNNGGDIAKLKQLMGHRDIRMTAAYLRCLPTDIMRQDVEMVTLDNLY